MLALFATAAQALAKLTKEADSKLDPKELETNKKDQTGIDKNNNLLERIDSIF